MDQKWTDIINTIVDEEQQVRDMRVKLKSMREHGAKIKPDSKDVFRAFELTPYDNIQVVIIGQDPYPDPDHPHGLAFSSRAKVTPDSLRNIFKEIHEDCYPGEDPNDLFRSNDLSAWAEQGVLLLNAILTVEAYKSGSHRDIGWLTFTERIMKKLNDHPNRLVFMLWGQFAKAYASSINQDKHLVLQAAHPSPLSAAKGYFGCRHFSQANEFIFKNHFKEFIDKKDDFYHSHSMTEYITVIAKRAGIELNDKEQLKDILDKMYLTIPKVIATMDENKHLLKLTGINWRT